MHCVTILCNWVHAAIFRCMDKRSPNDCEPNSVDSYTCFAKDIPRKFYYEGSQVKKAFFRSSTFPTLLAALTVRMSGFQLHLFTDIPMNILIGNNPTPLMCEQYQTAIALLDVSWPGSVHDSQFFKNSDVSHKVMTGELNGILLGDNGYGITPFLLTPFLTPNSPAERNYNHIHRRARCTIERTFGQVKRRFHCIGDTLRSKLDRVPSVIAVDFILHNLAKRMGERDFEGDDEEDEDEDFSDLTDQNEIIIYE